MWPHLDTYIDAEIDADLDTDTDTDLDTDKDTKTRILYVWTIYFIFDSIICFSREVSIKNMTSNFILDVPKVRIFPVSNIDSTVVD